MSKRVRFTADFDFSPKTNVIVAYKAGMEVSVPDPHAEAAITAKVAVEVPDEPRKLPPVPSPGKASAV